MRLKAAILADGNPLAPADLKRLRRGSFVVVLDGAAEAVRRARWLPDLVSGDFDGISRATLRYFEKKGVELLHTPDQDYTDLEKALAWCALRGFTSITLAQALGGRLDHSFTALSLLKRYHGSGRELTLLGNGELVRFARDERLTLTGRKGRAIAVLPFPRCRANSSGLRFELRALPLALGKQESVSNSARLSRVRLEIEGEALIVEALR
jgi:thiamine pyrophosphokinase